MKLKYKIFKRIFDLILSMILLIFFIPLIFFLFFLILLIDNQYPIFIQNRTGINKKIFRIYKFKTMKYDKITKTGSVIRKLRLDEILQLINILKNDMSFVGPRPLLEEYLKLYNKKQLKRFTVPQGITCFATINGGNKLSWKRKLIYDIKYVDNSSFCIDVKILFITALQFVYSLLDKKTDANIIKKFDGN